MKKTGILSIVLLFITLIENIIHTAITGDVMINGLDMLWLAPWFIADLADSHRQIWTKKRTRRTKPSPKLRNRNNITLSL